MGSINTLAIIRNELTLWTWPKAKWEAKGKTSAAGDLAAVGRTAFVAVTWRQHCFVLMDNLSFNQMSVKKAMNRCLGILFDACAV